MKPRTIHLAALFMVLIATPALAQPANKRAEKEARGYLTPCHFAAAHKQVMCLQNQANFVETYVYAKAGDVSSMSSTAASFSPPSPREEPDFSLGLPVDQVQACAWRIVTADASRATPNASLTQDMVRYACQALSGRRQDAAAARADHLEQELRTSPASLPPPPTAEELKGLDSTVHPLVAN